MEDDEWKKLPIEDKCVHKSWKARINGYEEVTKLFKQIDDEKSPEFGKYLGLIKKFVTDSNAASQEKGLEATLAYVENYAHAGKTVGEVMSGVVTKCMAAQKAKTKELALQVTLMYIEIEKQEAVIEELIKGTEQKNPKIVSACVSALTVALHEFGSKVINVKPAVKKISTLFADRDKNVRDEAKAMVVEMYKWIGPALKSQLNGLQAVQITELEAEFAKVEGQKVFPTRFLRSQQEKQSKLAAEAVENEDEEPQDEADAVTPIDAYDLADPVDILSKLPKNFYDQLESKKWQDRKEVLEILENLLKTPKLENGDYGDLVRALKKIVQKDSNVMVVTAATKCMGSLANGLKKRYQPYAGVCLPALLEKFKEKKQTVVVAIRDAVDAVYLATTIEAINDDVIEILNNKNPAVKSETALFLARAFTRTPSTAFNKKLLKAYSGALIKNINEPDPTVRDSSAEALGTLMKLVGEKALSPFLVELEKDNLKMSKIKEFNDKAVILVKAAAVKKERPTTASIKSSAPGDTAKAPTKKPASATQKHTIPLSGTATIVKTKRRATSAAPSSGTATIIKSKSKSTPERARENEISEEEAIEIASSHLTDEILNGLVDANWKTRLAATENMANKIQTLESGDVPTQAFVRVVKRKPGLKDTNFQVLKARLDIIKYLAENCKFSTTSGTACIPDVTDKLGDAKNGAIAAETLTALAEATKLDFVAENVMDFAFNQKSPKVMQESLVWLSGAIKEFGFGNLNVKSLIENTKKALSSTNPSVRSSGIAFLGTLYLYMGPTLHMFFENEKPALMEQINAEFSKYDNEKPPAPTRGLKKSPTTESLGDGEESEGACAEVVEVNIQDQFPRVDISAQISEVLITEMSDKNWKVRNEAIIKISNIILESKLIKPNIGDLPQALAHRLVDSNTKIAQAALAICENIANAMGAPCKQYIRVFLPGFLQGLGDSKAWIRSGSINCMNTYGELCAYKEFFESEMIADALKTGSPTLRIELWNWLAEKLPKMKSIPKEELHTCIPHLYSNLEDRNAEVRKNAQEAVLGFMIHLGYESMLRQTEKLKPGSKATVVAALDKARPNLPIKPLPKAKAPEEKESKAVRGTKSATAIKSGTKTKGPAAPPKSAPVRKKEEDIDTSPLLTVNNMKHQRTIDESKLKVLKWNFTTPREEFVELLREQMTNAFVNRNLIANMFHSDFRYHLKAIDSLMEALPDNIQATISNLDLILKWVTLRFFDTNPSVLLKALEYLHSVFNALIENKYHLLESEASSFIPYLCLKTGDPKDTVRNGVRSLFNQICNIFPVSKLFSYVMEGLKSKNARQRTECLDIMGSLIENYGIGVCVPSPAVCLKEVAKQISDRDNSVRNAALNCVVQAYYIVGEKVYKMVGQISDKDMSLLEERIKRAKKPAPKMIAKVEPMTAVSFQPVRSTSHDRNSSINNLRAMEINNSSPNNIGTNGQMDIEDDVIEEDEFPRVTPLLPQAPQQETTEYSGPFQLDPELIRRLDSIKYDMPKLELYQFDLDFLKEEIVVPSLDDARIKVMPMSAPNPILPNQSPFSGSASSYNRQAATRDYLMEKLMKQMSSTDKTLAFEAMDHLQTLLVTSKGLLMSEYEESFMSGIAMQLKLLAPEDPRTNESVTRMYRLILTALNAFYQNKNVGTKVSVPLLKEVLTRFIMLLVDAKLEGCNDGDAFVRVVNVHCVKIIERSDHSNTICALIQLLHECIKSDSSPRLTELVMKCLWRVIKIMPTWAEELDYDSILLDIHNFLKDFPSAWWKTKPSDTPMRTIKTIVHSMTKAKGGQLMFHLGKVPNTSESELESYILRLLKSLKLEEVKQIPVKTDTLSKSAQKTLREIFEKMGKKSDGKDALNLLYDFLQQHPEVSIEPYLKESKVLQDYVNNGLKEIEKARKTLRESEKIQGATDSQTSSPKGVDSKGVEYYKDRLKMWNEVWDKVTKGSPQK